MENGKIECPYCNKNIVEGIPFCPYCGKKQPQTLNKDEINKNPYEILQISEDAEHEVIEAAYRSLAKKYHPDSGSSSVSEDQIREINWAHEILSDPAKTEEWKLKNRRRSATRSSTAETVRQSQKSTPTESRSQSVPQYPPLDPQAFSSQPRSKEHSNTPIWITVIVVAVLIICVVFFSIISRAGNGNSSFQSRAPTSTRRPVNTPTRPPSSLVIKFINECDVTINTAIYYQNLQGNWISEGWWVLSPNETASVARTINPTFYTYGQSSDGTWIWEGTDTYQIVRGSTNAYGFDYTYIEDWDLLLQDSSEFSISFLCE